MLSGPRALVRKTTPGVAAACEASLGMVFPGEASTGEAIVRPFPSANSSTLPPVHSSKMSAEKTKRRRNTQPIVMNPSCTASGGSDRQYSSARLNAMRSSMNLRPVIGPPHAHDHGKLTVILDVDETLIHSRLSSQQESLRQAEERKQDANAVDEFVIHLEDGEVVRVNKRPGLDRFLAEASKKYELFAYTAGLEEYAKPLLDFLDPKGTIFRHRLYRDSCLFMRGYYLKDLQRINRPLSRCVLVDNNAFCFLPQLSNGIPISSFYDDPNDSALGVLTSFLEKIDSEHDVRPFLRQNFDLETLLRDHREQIVG
mmetsp:Transcript_23934/g.42187  ORF Transcript_23934/g.42187 Transcript_23934/m.42187 type:complete len:313 (-) Transcript_23934:96-1034(-)